MNQSAILAAALLAGFGLFIASRDRLPVYARVLWGDKPDSFNSGGNDESGEGNGSSILDPAEGSLLDPYTYTIPEFIEDMEGLLN